MRLLLLLLVGCDGCRPDLPVDEPDPVDTSDRDTATHSGTTETAETGPVLPPRCDAMEVEPNDRVDQTMEMGMERWMCGVLMPEDPYNAPLGDVEYLSFSNTQPGWIEVSVEAARRGSSADMQLVLYDSDASVTVYDGYQTSDPVLRFPEAALTDFTLVLGESRYGFGDSYDWYTLASLVKAPVEWAATEIEPNDQQVLATVYTMGTTIYGTVDSAGDFDWFRVTVPEGTTTVRFSMNAFKLGSPIDGQLLLYDTDGTTLLRDDHDGQLGYDRDPWFEWRPPAPGDYPFLIRNETTNGSRFHWYTVTVEAFAE